MFAVKWRFWGRWSHTSDLGPVHCPFAKWIELKQHITQTCTLNTTIDLAECIWHHLIQFNGYAGRLGCKTPPQCDRNRHNNLYHAIKMENWFCNEHGDDVDACVPVLFAEERRVCHSATAVFRQRLSGELPWFSSHCKTNMHNASGSVCLQRLNSLHFCQEESLLSSSLPTGKITSTSMRENVTIVNRGIFGLSWFLTHFYFYHSLSRFCRSHVASKFPLGPKVFFFFF